MDNKSVTPSNPSIGVQLYEDAAKFGGFYGKLVAVIFFILGTGLIAGGIYYYRKVNTYLETEGTIISENCGPAYDNASKTTTTKCSIRYSYKVNNTEYKQFSNTGLVTYKEGEKVKVFYDPSNPSDSLLGSTSNPGLFISLFGLFLVLSAGFVYYTTTRYKFAAAGQGAASVFNLFRR